MKSAKFRKLAALNIAVKEGAFMPNKIESTYVNLEITVCGVTREVEADVTYIHTPAFGAIYDGSGPISPPEPENAEIQSVRIQDVRKEHGALQMHDITNLLTDDQIDAISSEILENR